MLLLEIFYAEIKNDSNGTRTWSYNLENTYGNSTREIFVFPKLDSTSPLLLKLQYYSVELRLNIKCSGTRQHEIADKNQSNTNQVEKQKLHILSNLCLLYY